MANEKQLIDRNKIFPNGTFFVSAEDPMKSLDELIKRIWSIPTVEAVELPNGKPGDYLEWDCGLGYTKIYYISAIYIGTDSVRYDLGVMCPVVNHPCILRILNREEAEAALAKMDGDGNG